MEPLVPEHDQLRSFLLGTLPEVEREELEDRLIDDGEFFTELVAAEDDLVEEYARGELTPDERVQMEKGLLSLPLVRRRAELLRALQVTLARATPTAIPEPKRSFFPSGFWQFAAVSVAVVLLAGIAWWWIRGRSDAPRTQGPVTAGVNQPPTPLPSAAPSTTNTPATGPTDGTNPPLPTNERNDPPPPVQSTVATLVLLGGMTRGDGNTTVLQLTPQTGSVRIELTLESTDNQRYRATLYDENGRQLWRSGPTPPHGPAVTIEIPARALNAGDHRIKLEGLTDGQYTNVDNYTFRVRTSSN